MLLRPKFGSNTIHTFSTEWTAMVVTHCIELHRIIYLYVNFGLTNTGTAKADTNSTIWNDLVYINNTVVQVRPKMTLRHYNQYFCFGVVYFNTRPNQLICGLPIDQVTIAGCIFGKTSGNTMSLRSKWAMQARMCVSCSFTKMQPYASSNKIN